MRRASALLIAVAVALLVAQAVPSPAGAARGLPLSAPGATTLRPANTEAWTVKVTISAS